MTKMRVVTFLGFVVSAFFILISLRGIDLALLGSIIGDLDAAWVGAASALNLAVMVVKAYRWQMAIVGARPIPFRPVFNTLMVGSMVSNVLPLKAGEVVRAVLLGRHVERPSANLLSSVAVDRIMDNFGFFVMAALAPLWFDLPREFLPATFGFFVVLIGIAAALFFLSRRRWESHQIPERGLKFHLYHLSTGLGAISSPRRIAFLVLTSLVSWLLQVALVLSVERAFGMSLPSGAPLFILLVVNLAIALPSTPGHLGTFEYGVIFALATFLVPKETALGFGLVYHLVQWVPVTLWGWLLLGKMGLRVKDVSRQAA